jgi:hypothetical protein
MSDTSRFVADVRIVDLVRCAIVENNPNEPEELDEAAIKDLANYVGANDLIELHEDGDMIDKLFDPNHEDCLAYFLYDLFKWTRANGSTVELDGELI